MTRQQRGDHGTGNDQRGREVLPEPAAVLHVESLPAADPERALEPLHVMIAGQRQHRCALRHPVDEATRRLELAVARPLGQVARYHDRAGLERRYQALDVIDHRQVAVAPEVQVGQVNQRYRRHHTVRIVYVSTTSPFAGTVTLNRVTLDDIFSAGTELVTTDHSPPRSSRTSTACVLSEPLLMVTLNPSVAMVRVTLPRFSGTVVYSVCTRFAVRSKELPA